MKITWQATLGVFARCSKLAAVFGTAMRKWLLDAISFVRALPSGMLKIAAEEHERVSFRSHFDPLVRVATNRP